MNVVYRMKDLGYHQGYKYTPDFTSEEEAAQTYLPDSLAGRTFLTQPNWNTKPAMSFDMLRSIATTHVANLNGTTIPPSTTSSSSSPSTHGMTSRDHDYNSSSHQHSNDNGDSTIKTEPEPPSSPSYD
jgi:spore germination cell wall hydrolase CwlJ-like protein